MIKHFEPRDATPDNPSAAFSEGRAWRLGPARLPLLALCLLLLAAFAIRIYRLGNFPDTVLGDEADNVQSAVRILHGQPPQNGFFGMDWTQQPAFSAYKEAAFIALFGFDIFAMRLPSALISTLALIPFYLLLRRQLSALASMLASILLATDVWYLNFSRSGWNCIDVGFYMLMAMLFLLLALQEIASEQPRQRRALGLFALAGAFCALGLYAYPAGRAIVVGTLAFCPVAAVWFYRRHIRALLLGYLVLTASVAILFAPQAVYALRNWNAFNTRTRTVFIFNSSDYKSDPAGTMLRQFSNNLRGPWDGRVNNTPQYSPVGEPQLDRFTGVLVPAGMLLSFSIRKLRGRPETWLWWLMLLSGWFFTQILTAKTPDGARGIGYMPTLIYFAGITLDGMAWALSHLSHPARWLPRTNQWVPGLLTACVLLAGAANVMHYVSWQSQPHTRAMRYIYVTASEFPNWAADITYRASHGMGVTNLDNWRAVYPIQNASNP